jgi:hypothetical protein
VLLSQQQTKNAASDAEGLEFLALSLLALPAENKRFWKRFRLQNSFHFHFSF